MADQPLRPDVQAAADRMGTTMGAEREIRKLVEYLWEGETVRHMTSGAYGPGSGLLALTDGGRCRERWRLRSGLGAMPRSVPGLVARLSELPGF